MPTQLNLNDEVAAAEAVTGSSTGWATKVLEALRAGFHSTVNPFGSAAVRNAGSAAGEVPLVGTGNRLAAAVLPNATESAPGVAELATVAEAAAGTRGDVAVTPAGLARANQYDPIFQATITFTSDTSAGATGYGLRSSTATANVSGIAYSAGVASSVTLLLSDSLPDIGAVILSPIRNGATTVSWVDAFIFENGAKRTGSNKHVSISCSTLGVSANRLFRSVTAIGYRSSFA